MTKTIKRRGVTRRSLLQGSAASPGRRDQIGHRLSGRARGRAGDAALSRHCGEPID